MKIISLAKLIISIFLSGSLACGQPLLTSNVTSQNKNSAFNQPLPIQKNSERREQTEKFNKFFSGEIGDDIAEKSKVYLFQMRLQRLGKQLSGKYRYSNSKSDILLNGKIDDENKFVLEESFAGKITGKFEGTFENDGEDNLKMFGTWAKAGSEDFVGFSANEIPLEMSGEVYFQNLSIEERSKGFDISLNYPQFSGGDFTSLNLVLKNIQTRNFQEFKKYKPEKDQTNSMEGGFTIHYANDNFVALEFAQESFTGGAHPGHWTTTLNYDLKLKKKIMLADLFKPNSKYLQKLSQISRELLGESLQFEEGIKPTVQNFSDFLLTKKGLLIYFEEYQVAPYAAGQQEVLIPYGDLQDLLQRTELLKIK